MPVYVKKDKVVLFVHIPKTGGSSVNELFVSSGWDRFFYGKNIDDTHKKLRYVYKSTPQHWEKKVLKNVFRTNRFTAMFCISRHPISRFKSEFAYRNKDLSKDQLTKRFVTKWLLRNLWQYFKNRNHKDNHLKPQSRFIFKGIATYKSESGFQQIFEQLNRDFNLDLPTTRELRKKNSETFSIQSKDVPISLFARYILWVFYLKDFLIFRYPFSEPHVSTRKIKTRKWEKNR